MVQEGLLLRTDRPCRSTGMNIRSGHKSLPLRPLLYGRVGVINPVKKIALAYNLVTLQSLYCEQIVQLGQQV